MKNFLIQNAKRLIPWIGAGFFILAVLVARHELKGYHVGRVRDLVLNVPPLILAKVVLITAVGYAVLALYDLLSLRALGKKVAIGKIAFTAFLSFAVSHNAGHAWLSGSSLRYRFYSAWGVSGVDILKLMFFNTAAYGLGLCSLLLTAYALSPPSLAGQLHIAGYGAIIAFFASVYVGYWIAVITWRPHVTWKNIEMRLPSWRITLMQAVVGSGDILLSGLVLYFLLTTAHSLAFSAFFIVYVFALILGTLSQVPGGLGVFEAIMLRMLSDHYPAAEILASLVLYRVIYYFLPLGLAGIFYLAYEMRLARHGMKRIRKIP